jgi:tripartite-type tricarboxylate transporter receptor subunit TctC
MKHQIFLTVFVGIAGYASGAIAQIEDTFYKGKSVSVVVGFAPGGSYDGYARLLARHIGRHITGEPTVIVQNMPGAGSLTAVRYLDGNAPKDGTVMTAFNAGLITESQSDPQKFNFRFSELGWVGSITRDFSVCYAWHAKNIKSLSDAQKKPEFIIGGTARGSSSSINSAILGKMLNIRVRSILGYSGSSESRLAVERGELDGHCGAWVSIPQDWRNQNKIIPFVRFSASRLPDMPETAVFVGDLLATDEDRAVTNFLLAATEVGRPYVVSKHVPSARLAILRNAFAKAVADAELLSEADKQGFPISAIGGQESEQLINSIYAAPPAIAARASEILK